MAGRQTGGAQPRLLYEPSAFGVLAGLKPSRGKVPSYRDTSIDEVDTDMLRALGILNRNDYDGILISRPGGPVDDCRVKVDARRTMRFPHLLVSGLVYAVVGVLVVYVAISLIAGTQRTAEAPITVDSLLPAQSAGRSGPIAGWSVTYRFQAADGRTIVDEAFRTWDPDVIRAAKACYEPGNPDNHELVQPTIACPR